MSAKDLIPFTKGDPRINRKGRPKTLKALRKLIQKIGAEDYDGNPEWTNIETLLRAMMRSKNSADHIGILKYGWGEPSQATAMLNVDMSTLSDEAVARIAAGEDVLTVIAGKGTGREREAQTADANTSANRGAQS